MLSLILQASSLVLLSSSLLRSQRLQAPHIRLHLQLYTRSEHSVIKDTGKGEKVGAK